MPTGLYTRLNYDTESQNFIPRQSRTRSFEKLVLSYFQQTRPECNIERNVTTGRPKKIDCFSVDWICNYCNTVFEAMGCYFHNCPCQEARPSMTDNANLRGIKKKEQDQMRNEYIQQIGYKIIEMWECNWWKLYRTDAAVKMPSSKFPLSTTSQRRTTNARDYECKVLWLRSMQPHSSWRPEGILCQLSSNFQKKLL